MKFRLLILGVGLFAFGMMTAIYVGGRQYPNLNVLYHQVIALWGVPGFTPYLPFLDLHGTLSWLQCYRLGWDVFVANPCHPLGLTANYTPLWLAAAPVGLTAHDATWLGMALVLAFLCSVAWISNARSLGQAGIYIIALLSQTCAFAIERCNPDLLMFLIVVAACAAFQHGAAGRMFAYSSVLIASMLKIYPIAAMGLALYERKRIFTIVASTTVAIWIIFLLAAWHQFVEIWPRIPRPGPFGPAFGGANIFHFVNQAATINWASAQILYALAIPTSIALSIAVSRKLRAIGISAGVMNRELATFLAGGLIIVFAFFATVNIYYRGIFLLALLPLSISLWRDAALPCAARRLWATVIVLIIVLLWIPALIYNVDNNLGFTWLARTLILTVREPLWWLFIVCMMAMLWIQLSSAPSLVAILFPLSKWRARGTDKIGVSISSLRT
jgi:hypothetical protein